MTGGGNSGGLGSLMSMVRTIESLREEANQQAGKFM
jgi:hypothetical protein